MCMSCSVDLDGAYAVHCPSTMYGSHLPTMTIDWAAYGLLDDRC
jgi:hypothetical protein